MENNASSAIGSYSIIAIFAGMALFIVSDLGLFSSLKNLSNFSFDGQKEKRTLSPEESLLDYSGNLKKEIVKIEKSLDEERQTLRTVQKEISNSQAEVRKKKVIIENLEKEIVSLTQLKNTLVSANRQKAGTLPRGDSAVSDSFTLWPRAPASVGNFSERLEARTGGVVTAESFQHEDSRYLRFKGPISYSAMNGLYLSGPSLRHVSLFSEGAAKMGYKRFVLAYSSNDNIVFERLQVISRYLQQRLGSDIEVSRVEVAQGSSTTIKDNLEIWASNEDVR